MTHFEKDKKATIRYYERFRNILDECIASLRKAESEEDMVYDIELLSSKENVITMQFEHDIDQYNKESDE